MKAAPLSKKQEKSLCLLIVLTPILVTPSGICIHVSELQLENALSPIIVTLSGILISVREVQPPNADSFMSVTPAPILTLVKEVQSKNKAVSTIATLPGSSISLSELQ